jgi:hypothetical protein
MDPELKAYLEGMRQDLMAHAEQLNQETRQDLMAHAERLNDKTNQRIDIVDQRVRETRVLIEDVRHEVQLVAEGVTTVRDQLGRVVADHEERITRLERRVP